MRTITMTPTEFVSFKQLATFFFDLYVKGGFVFITANADALDALGY
jgi:hypothetical protein